MPKEFSSAQEYWLLEDEMRFELEERLLLDPLAEKRILFREIILNEQVFRTGRAHYKIMLIIDCLEKFNSIEDKRITGRVTFEEELCKDIIEANLLELAEVAKIIRKLFYSKISNYGELCRRINREKLKIILTEKELEDYSNSRAFLFPKMATEKVNVPDAMFIELANELNIESDKLIAFRDKVIAHKRDPDRFKIRLTFQEYFDLFQVLKKYLDAISIVATHKYNDWSILEQEDQESMRIKNWICNGLMNSLDSLKRD
jgi:hypothetical protein